MTDYKDELEFLHTLVSFPDEMVSYYDSEFDGKLNSSAIQDKIVADLKKSLKDKYGDQADEIYETIVIRSKNYVDSKKAFLVPEKRLKSVVYVTNKKPSIWRRFWNWVRRKDEVYQETAEKFEEVKDSPTKLNCSYALMSFLKV